MEAFTCNSVVSSFSPNMVTFGPGYERLWWPNASERKFGRQWVENLSKDVSFLLRWYRIFTVWFCSSYLFITLIFVCFTCGQVCMKNPNYIGHEGVLGCLCESVWRKEKRLVFVSFSCVRVLVFVYATLYLSIYFIFLCVRERVYRSTSQKTRVTFTLKV